MKALSKFVTFSFIKFIGAIDLCDDVIYLIEAYCLPKEEFEREKNIYFH